LNIQREVNTTRMLRTPLGRLRIFFGRMDETTYRSAIAFKPQSLVGDLINLAMVEFEKRMPGKIICQVHDEIVLLVYDEEVDKAARLLKEVTEIPIQIEGVSDPLVIPLEVNVGQDWYNVKEYTI
jgi:DNA polymerase-1